MISLKYALLCDDIRREDNGKALVIGLYLPDITVPSVPVVVPSLCLFLYLESDTTGHTETSMSLERVGDGLKILETRGGLLFKQVGPGVSVLRLGSVQFTAAGTYKFVIEIEGQKDPLVVEFGVVVRSTAQSPSA